MNRTTVKDSAWLVFAVVLALGSALILAALLGDLRRDGWVAAKIVSLLVWSRWLIAGAWRRTTWAQARRASRPQPLG